jgi:hypothetical protein
MKARYKHYRGREAQLFKAFDELMDALKRRGVRSWLFHLESAQGGYSIVETDSDNRTTVGRLPWTLFEPDADSDSDEYTGRFVVRRRTALVAIKFATQIVKMLDDPSLRASPWYSPDPSDAS